MKRQTKQFSKIYEEWHRLEIKTNQKSKPIYVKAQQTTVAF